MSEAGKRLIAGATEALAVARGEEPAASITVNGHRYVPAAEITRLQKELETAREALERIVAPGTVSGMHAQDRAAKLQFIAWRALQDKEVAG